MGRLRFFLKLAFICNLCFLLGELFYYIDYRENMEGAVKHILILGFLVAFPLNILVSLAAVIMLARRKIAWAALPPYVFIINVVILIAQFFFLF